MHLSDETALGRFRSARVAHLATVSAAGQPHLVPVTFALRGKIIVTAVDHKPKATTNLKRLRNITETGRVSLLADDYDDQDWSRLWWVRVDGAARIVYDEQERAVQVERLCEKYVQYRENPPAGPVIWVEIDALTGWAYQD
ncbi:MAG: TIGR03668 family PPOX class F420-dependent oxidoreductase [Pseudonocardiaceae bacterium]